jgi:hypothetical protein
MVCGQATQEKLSQAVFLSWWEHSFEVVAKGASTGCLERLLDVTAGMFLQEPFVHTTNIRLSIVQTREVFLQEHCGKL